MPRPRPASLRCALGVQRNPVLRSAVTIAALCAVAAPVMPSAHAAPTPPATKAAASTVPALPAGLDKGGNVLPKTNYAIPSRAVFMATSGKDSAAGTKAAPVRSINAAVKLAPDGGTIVLRGGEYRDWYHNKDGTSYGFITKSLTFQAYPGETPWFNGMNMVATSQWAKTAGKNLWSMSWKTPQFCDGGYYSRPLDQQQVKPNAGPCAHYDMSKDPANPLAADPQLVYVNNVGLRQVTSLAKITASTFFYDWKAKRIYIASTPVNKKVEAAVRPTAMILSNKGAGFKILGIGFRKFATNQFHNLTSSAVYVGGSKLTMENSVFAENAAGSLSFSNPRPGSVVRKTVFSRNGYTALGASGSSRTGQRNDLMISGNVLYRNNAELFGTGCSTSCGQAAAKFAHMVGLTLTGNLVEETRGNAGGLWCDLDCTDVKVTYNTIRNNPGAGIFYEVSSRGTIAANLVSGSSYGIVVASATTKVYNNTLVDNVQGINVYDDSRTRGRDGWDDVGPDTRNVEVVNNVVSGRNYSLIGSSSKINAAAPNTGAEHLFSRIDYNAFHQSNGTAPIFVSWRTLAGKQTQFRTKASFTAFNGAEKSGAWLTGAADPLFTNKAGGDLRIRSGSPAANSSVALPADVASALGVASTSGRNRGSFAKATS